MILESICWSLIFVGHLNCKTVFWKKNLQKIISRKQIPKKKFCLTSIFSVKKLTEIFLQRNKFVNDLFFEKNFGKKN